MENFLIPKKRHSDIMDFQLQMYSWEAEGKGACITRMGTGRNYYFDYYYYYYYYYHHY